MLPRSERWYRESEIVKDDSQVVDQRRAEEFAELYSSCQHRLYVYIVTLIGNHFDAHDVLQDTNLVLWRNLTNSSEARDFIAWAREVARYRVLRYRQLHANDTPTLEPFVLDVLANRLNNINERSDSPYSAALPDCIERLSDGDRELVDLRYASGMELRHWRKDYTGRLMPFRNLLAGYGDCYGSAWKRPYEQQVAKKGSIQ